MANPRLCPRPPALRLARGPTRTASDEMPILRLARGRLGNNPSPLPRPISPTERRVQLMRPTTPATSAGRRLDTAERSTGREIASTPYRSGQDKAGVTGRCARYCAHDRRPYCTVLPNPCSRNNAACGLKSGLLYPRNQCIGPTAPSTPRQSTSGSRHPRDSRPPSLPRWLGLGTN